MKSRLITTFNIELSRDEAQIIYDALISKMNTNDLNDKEIVICEQMITEIGELVHIN